MAEESAIETIKGILTAMSHTLLFSDLVRYILELQNEKGRLLIFIKHSHLDSFQNQLEIGSTYSITQLTSNYYKYKYGEIQVWETTTTCKLFLLKKPLPLPKNLHLNSKMRNYKGKVTRTQPLFSTYELDGKLELCLAFVDMRSSCPRLSVGQEVTVYNAHIAEGTDNKKCLVMCGRGFVKVHSCSSRELYTTLESHMSLAFLVTQCNLGYVDYCKVRRLTPVLEEKFSNDFLLNLGIQDPQVLRFGLFVLAIQKSGNIEKSGKIEKYNMSEEMSREFMCLPHRCIVSQKTVLDLQMQTVKSCIDPAGQHTSESKCWSFSVTPGSFLVGYLSVSGQTGGWILSDASQYLDCVITTPNFKLSVLQKMDRAFVMVKQYYVIMETFQINEDTFERRSYICCTISEVCLLKSLSSYQNKVSTLASETPDHDHIAGLENKNVDNVSFIHEKQSSLKIPSVQVYSSKCTCENSLTSQCKPSTVVLPIESTTYRSVINSTAAFCDTCNSSLQMHTVQHNASIDNACVAENHLRTGKQFVHIKPKQTQLTVNAEDFNVCNCEQYTLPENVPSSSIQQSHSMEKISIVKTTSQQSEADPKTVKYGSHTPKHTCTLDGRSENATSIQHKPQSTRSSCVEDITQLNVVDSRTTLLNHDLHEETCVLICCSSNCTTAKNKSPLQKKSVKTASLNPNNSDIKQSNVSPNDVTVLLHQKSSVMKESTNSPPQCCLLVSLVENFTQEADNESPSNQSDARRCILVMRGPLLKQMPFLLIGLMYKLTLPPGCQFINLCNTASWASRMCNAVPHRGAVYLPRGSQLSMLQSYSLVLPCVQDIVSVGCVKDASHSEILNVNGIVYDCLHITPTFASEVRSFDVAGFGIPGMRTVVLKLRDSTVSNDTICLYLCKWTNCRYPLGMVIGAHICATFVKKVISKNTYLQSTGLTYIEILAYSPNPPKNVLDKDIQSLIYTGQELSSGSVVSFVLCPFVQKLSLRPTCSQCHSLIEDNACSYSGCFAVNSSIVEASATCVDNGLLGQVIIHFKNDHVRQLLGIPEKVWHHLIQVVKRGNEITSFKRDPRKQTSTSLAERVLQQYCSVVPMQHRLYVQCRVMKPITTGDDSSMDGAKQKIPRLFCLEIQQAKSEVNALLCTLLSSSS